MKCIRIKRKKGDITDSLAFLITIFILGVGLFILAWIIPTITSGLNQANLNNTVEGRNAIAQLNDYGMNGIQRGFFFLFIGLCIAQLISAYFVNSHPIWLFLYIIILAITIILAAYLGNVYEGIINLDAFSGFQQGYITAVMQNIIKIVIGVSALSFIIIFVKFYLGQGGQERL
jgi:small-conductance mechanosensitive channel